MKRIASEGNDDEASDTLEASSSGGTGAGTMVDEMALVAAENLEGPSFRVSAFGGELDLLRRLCRVCV